MSWRVAECLDQLLAEINAAAPKRNKASDGSIGDADHSARESDHNPCTEHGENPGVVCARDFTHDPPDFDAHAFARWLAPRMASGVETRCKYVISNREVASASSSPPWSFRPYDGANPHANHVHVSVAHPSTLFDDDRAWGWGAKASPPPSPLAAVIGDETMIVTYSNGSVYLAGGKLTRIKSQTDLNALRASGEDEWKVSDAQYETLGRAYGKPVD